jgi:ATP-binding cassette subfamily C (CFTR/MRP) protein 1
MRYRPDTDQVLKDLSFKIESGEKIGIVGRTGAGKSTISLCLSRIVEIFGGEIKLDGVNLKNIDIGKVREKITVIPQDASLFTGSLRFNMDPEDRVKDDQDIISLLSKAGLTELLKHSEGLKQPITENGGNLSSGEKQLICICRAILRRNKVIVMDEATANIDIITEQKIQELIKNEFKECTVITIAHRLNTIIESDRVLVLSFGQFKEFDSPQNLMDDPTTEFSKLVKSFTKASNQ